MKKLLKSEICESVNSTRCAVIGPKNLKSQSLRLLFIEQCMNSSRNTQNAPKRVKKKKNVLEKRKRRITFAFCVLPFFFFFFSFLHAFQTFRGQAQQYSTVWPCFFDFSVNQWVRALFMDPQISFFINFFIKNGSHSTIHTFKNYFATVF